MDHPNGHRTVVDSKGRRQRPGVAADGRDRVRIQCRHGQAHHAAVGMPGHVDAIGIDRDLFLRVIIIVHTFYHVVNGHFQKERIDGLVGGQKGRIVQTAAGHGGKILVVVFSVGIGILVNLQNFLSVQEPRRVETTGLEKIFPSAGPHHHKALLFGLLHPSRVAGRIQWAAPHAVHVHDERNLARSTSLGQIGIKATFFQTVLLIGNLNAGLGNGFCKGQRQCVGAGVTELRSNLAEEATQKEEPLLFHGKHRWDLRW